MSACPITADDFLTLLFADALGKSGMLILSHGVRTPEGDPHGAIDRWRDIPFDLSRVTLARIAQIARQHTEREEVFFACGIFAGKVRREAQVVGFHFLYADLDSGIVADGVPAPSVILETSPGRSHAFWKLAAPIDRERAVDLNRRLARACGGDPSGVDATQVLRLPETINHKYPERPIVSVTVWSPKCAYTPEDFAHLPPVDVRRSSSVRVNGHHKPIPQGQRHTTLIATAAYLRNTPISDAALEAALIAENNRCDPALPEAEVRRIAQWALSKEATVPARSPPVPLTSGHPDVTHLPVREPYPPPLAAAAFHGLMGDIVTAYDGRTEAAPAPMLVQGLVAYGNVVGRSPHVMVGETRQGTNEFAAIVGNTAHARKGTGWDNIYSLFRDAVPQWADECLLHGLGSGEGLIEAVADKPGDGTDSFTEKRRLVQEGEFAGILAVQGREGSRLGPILKDVWDGKMLRNTVRHNPVRATGAHISIIAHITREELQTGLSESDRRNGYGNRFLWTASARAGRVPRPKPLPMPVKNDLVIRLKQAIDHGTLTGAVDFDADTDAYWRVAVYDALTVDHPGLVGALTARAEAHVIRLALIYCLLDGEDTIRRVHLDAALALWTYCLASTRWAFGDRLGNRTAEGIIRFLRSQPEGASKSDIRSLFGRNKSSSELADALGLLIDNGLVTYETRRPEGGRGAPIEWWRLTNL